MTETPKRSRRRRPPKGGPADRRARRQAAVRRRRAIALAAGLILVVAAVAFATVDRGGTSPAKAESTAPAASTAGSAASSAASTGAEVADTGSTATVQAVDRPPPAGPPVTIGWAGDTVPAASDFGLPDDPTQLLGGVTRILSQPQLMIGNLEGTLTKRGSSKCGAGSSNCYSFRSPPSYAQLLSKAGFDVMNLANNHAFDFGRVGLNDTHKALSGAGIAYTGAPGQVTVKQVQGVRIGIVGFASYTWSARVTNMNAVKKLVQKADAQADLVVAVFHGGAEGSNRQHVPNGGESQYGENRGNLRLFARTAVNAGADLVIGSGPHVIRGMQFYKGRLIAYSAGNFVGYKVFSLGGPLSVSYVLAVTLKPDGTWVSGKMTPTRLISPGFADDDPSGAAISSVRDLSRADFGKSAARIGDDGAILPPT